MDIVAIVLVGLMLFSIVLSMTIIVENQFNNYKLIIINILILVSTYSLGVYTSNIRPYF